MAIKTFNYIEYRKLLHMWIAVMIMLFLNFLIGLNNIQSFITVVIIGILWELFNKFQHLVGMPKNIFDDKGLSATIIGGCVGYTISSIAEMIFL